MTRFVLAGFILLLIGCGPNTPSGSPSVGPGKPAGWPAYGATPGGTHFSPATQITPENVAWLEQAWVHNSGDFRDAGPTPDGGYMGSSAFQVTPILVDEALYYCTPFNRVFALNARTGKEIWSYDPQVDINNNWVLPNCRGVSSWKAPDWQEGDSRECVHRIVTGTVDARLIALDAATGEPCTDFGENGAVDITPEISRHDPLEYGITSPPAILNDLIITGSMVLDNVRTDIPSGVVRAYDIRTGEQRWAWNPVPPGMEQRDDDGSFRSGTTNVWSIISVDPERDLVFIPTGNTSPDYYGGHRDGLDYYSSSVVALHAATGEVAWHYQMVHHDIWDYDTPAQPTLIDLEVDGEMVPVVVQVTKMGLTFVLHRDTGKPVYPVEERPVPQNPAEGEYLSPTQPFPTHFPNLVSPISADDAWGMMIWDEMMCANKLEALRNEGIYTPPTVEGSLFYPGNGGGNNWGSPAINPGSQTMFVITLRTPNFLKLTPREECEQNGRPNQQGTPYCSETSFLMSPLGVPCVKPPWATLDAVDLVAGEILWSVPYGTTRDLAPFPFWWIEGIPAIGGVMTTSTGVVFGAGVMEHAFRAYSAQTGETLWEARLPTAANSTPMTYQLEEGGKQYVVVAAGGHMSGFNAAGDHLIAFTLPD
ncbi:MAG: quinoprotein glucose dehydrogenase [Candidatus Azotimanducaceae bacterium]|jgi:quinoprotein glucose dehydrogenase